MVVSSIRTYRSSRFCETAIMSEVHDDPREVLALLNSLGFVGITAPQLKAFMKDLKLHRKIKERERQQWKDETRRKILSKQEQMLREMMRETLAANKAQSPESTLSTESSVCNNSSMVRIKVRCLSKVETNENVENSTNHNIQPRSAKPEVPAKIDRPCRRETIDELTNSVEELSTRRRRERSKSYERTRLAELSTDSSQYVSIEKRRNSPRKGPQRSPRRNRDGATAARPLSAPELADPAEVPKERSKSVASDPTGLRNPVNPSRCSTRSNTKSFIRPWRLQPEAQRAASARKSDPVALYQKYRQEWKQISFPGEEQHARVRWAVREKMLGTDPNPRPILKKSQSLQSIKKR